MLLASIPALAFPFNAPDGPVRLELAAELGFVAPLAHRIRFGKDGDRLDYVEDGGQGVLFPFARPTAAVTWRRQRFVALWQPLDVRTRATLDEDLRVDDTVFPAGRPLDLRYGFSFWRLSWAHQLVDDGRWRVGLGLGLQIRNATIGFATADGSLDVTKRDVGPVPLLELELGRRFDDGAFVEAEIDGFWAPIRYLNGGRVDVEGAIADLQLRVGVPLAEPAEVFVGARYLGGGAQGTGPTDDGGDGYTENWLHTLVVTLGARVR